jgi:hypothetical protein
MLRAVLLFLLLALAGLSGCACGNSSVLKRDPVEDRYSAKYD